MLRSRRRQGPRGSAHALHHAAHLGSMERTVALLSSGSIDINQGDSQEFTPLMLAAFAGHASVNKILLNKDANVFTMNDQRGYGVIF